MMNGLPAAAFPVGFSGGKGATFTVAVLIGLALYLRQRSAAQRQVSTAR